MRTIFLMISLLMVFSGLSRAQVGISTDNSAPHPSAILDVKSTEKGFLPPRMTLAQRNAIITPAEGLIVYCTDCTSDGKGLLSVYRNGGWVSLLPDCISPAAPSSGSHIAGNDQIVWNWNAVVTAVGYRWNTVNNLSSSFDNGTGTTRTETGLDCNTQYTRYIWSYSGDGCTSSAPTILTASTLNSIPLPEEAVHYPTDRSILWIWNPTAGAVGYKWNTTDSYSTAIDLGNVSSRNETGLACNTLYQRYLWVYDACGTSQPVMLTQSTLVSPDPPAAGAHVPALTQVLWKWLAVDGATGYKWNSADDYGSAIDMGTGLMLVESGLTCNTTYTRYAWSYNSCGHSFAAPLIQSTTMNQPVSPSAGTHVATPVQITWNWGAVSGASGYKWNTTNNYTTATDMGTATTKTETGLTCNTAYTRYAWAYIPCGYSAPVTLLQATSTSSVPAVPAAGTHVPSASQIVWNWNAASGAAGYKWNTTSDFATSTDMGTSRTKTETGLACNTPYSRYVWAYSSCGGISNALTLNQATSISPSAPAAGTPLPALTQIVWNWNPVAGATGYKWNTVNDPGTATDMGTAITKTETGLTQFANYTRYVWAYNTCGISSSTSLASRTTSCGISVPVSHIAGEVAPVSKNVVYGTVTGVPGEPQKCWITRNLGADRQATAVDDASEPSAGWYWQFNRKQGYKYDGFVRTPNTAWITGINENSDWIAANDPCTIELGIVWRIPSNTEWNNVASTGGWTNWNGAWNSVLKLHAAGYIDTNGNQVDRGYIGVYSKSTQAGTYYGNTLSFSSYGLNTYAYEKATGLSLRCIREN